MTAQWHAASGAENTHACAACQRNCIRQPFKNNNMATNTIELNPANAVEPRQVTQLVGFKADGTMTAVNAAGFMAERKVSKNSDGIIDFDLITESGFYAIADRGTNPPLNSPLGEGSIYGILEVRKVGISTTAYYTMQRFSNVIDKISCAVYQRVRTEHGAFSPWVLISRGGGKYLVFNQLPANGAERRAA